MSKDFPEDKKITKSSEKINKKRRTEEDRPILYCIAASEDIFSDYIDYSMDDWEEDSTKREMKGDAVEGCDRKAAEIQGRRTPPPPTKK